MTNTAANSLTLIENAEMATIRIGEHIQEKKAAAKGLLRRAIDFLFTCEPDNPYNLPADLKAKLYL